MTDERVVKPLTGFWTCTCGGGMPIRAVTLLDFDALKAEVTKWKGNFTVKQGIVEELLKEIAEKDAALELCKINAMMAVDQVLQDKNAELAKAREVIEYAVNFDPTWMNKARAYLDGKSK